MKISLLLPLVFVLCSVMVELRGHEKRHQHGKHNGTEHKRSGHVLQGKSRTNISRHHQKGLGKAHSRIYKKYAMLAAPALPLEDVQSLQGQPQQASQQLMMPVGTRQGDSQEVVASYSSTPAQPSTLGTEVASDQTVSAPQAVSNAAGQPATVQYQGGQEGTDQGIDQGTMQQVAAGGETEVAAQGATAVDPNAGGDTTQSFTSQSTGQEDMKNLEVFNGAAPESEQSKPQVPGVGPQEEVKVVNLGDDEKLAGAQAAPCGGCPPGAKCVNGQCQIREEDAQAQNLAAKGSASNPETVSNIHNLETEELKSLLKEASKADPAPQGTSTPVEGTASLSQATTTSPEVTTASHEATTSSPQTAQATDTPDSGELQQLQSDSPQATITPTEAPKQLQQPVQPTFSQHQIKELREFARMYKMYQFIKRMEKRVNDPDCAPICRTMCKSFCPAKCCREHHSNSTLPNALSQTVNNFSATVSQPHPTIQPTIRRLDASLVEDDKQEDEDEKEEKEMNEMAGKKHLFVKIVRNNELDKPRNQIRRKI